MDGEATATAPASPRPRADGDVQLSKNAERKRRRYEAIRERRKQLRPVERARRRLAKKAADTLVNDRSALEDARDGVGHGVRIAIDLSYCELMSAKERAKLANQLKRCWGAQRVSGKLAQIFLVGFEKGGQLHCECCSRNDGFDRYAWNTSESKLEQLFGADDIVYLCPDSDAPPLEDIRLDKVYAIGGLVDECRRRGATGDRAAGMQAHSRRLPISEFMCRPHGCGSGNQTLTVNQVFDIVLRYASTNDWRSSLAAVLPKRFGFVPIEQSGHCATGEGIT